MKGKNDKTFEWGGGGGGMGEDNGKEAQPN